MHRLQLSSIAVTLFALSGCPLVDLALDVDRMCQTDEVSEEIAAGVAGELTTTMMIDEASWLQDLTERYDAGARLVDVTIVPGAAFPDLSAVDAASVTIASAADPELPVLRIASCQGDCASSGTLVIAGDLEAALIDYIRAGAIELVVTVTGELPPGPIDFTVDACFAADAQITY